MGPRSVMLIDHEVIPKKRSSSTDTTGVEYTAALSIYIKAMLNTTERPESRSWRIIKRAGLDVKHIRKITNSHDTVIIAVQKKDMNSIYT